MRLRGIIVATVFGLMAGAALVLAQQAVTPPLGDVAREAEAAKATVKKAKKTYTNADLTADRKGEPSPAPSPPNGFASASLGRVVTPDEMLKRSEEKVEQDAPKQTAEPWQARAESIRVQVVALQKRIADFSSPDPLRDSNPIAKSQNDNELTNARQGLDALKKQWDRLESSAKAEKANPAWLDPRPRF